MRQKNRYFVLCMIVIAYLGMEACAFLFYYALHGEMFSYAQIESRRTNYLSRLQERNDKKLTERGVIAPWDNHIFAVHPYTGYVMEKDTHNRLWKEYGFLAEIDPFRASANPKLAIVALTGGSVVEYLFPNDEARNKLRGYLQKLPAFRDKKIVLIMLGMAGYHEPQQLMAVTYYLSQGGRLDMLLNVDGFNELYYPQELYNEKIFPAYPSLWPEIYAEQYNANYLTDLAHIGLMKEVRYRTAVAFKYVNFSITAEILWDMLDRAMLDNLSSAQLDMLTVQDRKNVPYFVSGPTTMQGAPKEDMYNFQMTLWKSSSLQLHYLAQGNHFQYFHFLQPNPYADQSKSMTPEELQDAFSNGHNSQMSIVAKLHSSQQKALEDLRAQGVNTYDLTHIYSDSKESIYTDEFSHTTDLGKMMLVDAIGQRIVGAQKVK